MTSRNCKISGQVRVAEQVRGRRGVLHVLLALGDGHVVGHLVKSRARGGAQAKGENIDFGRASGLDGLQEGAMTGAWRWMRDACGGCMRGEHGGAARE